MSIRNDLIEAVIGALNASGRPSGIPAATRLRLGQVEEDAAIAVYPGIEKIRPATNRASPVVKRELEVIVEYRVTGDAPDELLDPLVSWGQIALASTADPDLHDVEEVELRQVFEIGRAVQGLARHKFIVRYQTRRDDPTQAA